MGAPETRKVFWDGVMRPLRWGRVRGVDGGPPAVAVVVDLTRAPDLASVWHQVKGVAGLDVITGWRCLLTAPPAVVFDVEILNPPCRFGIDVSLQDRSRVLRSLCRGQDLIVMTVEGMAAVERRDWQAVRSASFGVPAPSDAHPVEVASAWLGSAQHREQAHAKHRMEHGHGGRGKRGKHPRAGGRTRARRPS